MTNMLEVAGDLVATARGGEQIETYVVHEREFQVKVYGREVESLSSAEPRGAGIRVVEDQRVGFAYTTEVDGDGLRAALDVARANAQNSGRDDGAGLPEAWTTEPSEVPGIVDPGHDHVSPEQKVEFALELERATKDKDPHIRAVEEAVYSDSSTDVALATSTGISGSYTRTDAWCYSMAIAERDGESEMGFEFDLARGIGDLDPDRVAARATERAVEALGAEKIASERLPIIFDPYVAGQFLGVLAQALTGEAVQKGRSLFADRLGQTVADSKITLIDDGRLEGAPATAPWDGEGVPTGRTEVITGGVLHSFLYDTTTARREGRESTGNASRAGFKSLPHPSPSNLAIESTGRSATQIMEDAGRALLVKEFHGVHSGANPVSGDFSVGATGVLLSNGEPGQPVKEVTIAAPMLEILRNIVAVADDRRWLPFGGSYGGATTLVAEMTVGGR